MTVQHRHVGATADRRTSRRGQALVEMALLAPFLVLLLLGGAQVGEIAYSQVSLDSAAREGARAGVAAPNAALSWDAGGAVPATHRCTSADFVDGSGNPLCIAVVDASGYLDQTKFTANPCASGQACVTITVIGPNNLSAFDVHSPTARLESSSPCNNGQYATVNGTVSGIPSGMSATIADTSGDTQSGVTGAFTLCATANNSTTTQTITAQVGPVSCGGYSGSVGPFSVSKGQTYTNENVTVTAEPACPTSTPTPPPPTPTAVPTPTPTPGPTPTPTAGPGISCGVQLVPDSDYITVTVSYPVPVFVPLLGSIFQTQSGLRQISESVTYAIEPCTMTPP
jgi:Flp pilus assembly protein TadG